jgi:hypothetical protein
MGGKTGVWQGTLALMALKTVAMPEPMHGYGIAILARFLMAGDAV